MPYWHIADRHDGTPLRARRSLPLAFAAWKGRRYEDDEVRPTHARNIIQRLSLQAEVSAARQAQLRLLPNIRPRSRASASPHPARLPVMLAATSTISFRSPTDASA